MQYLDESALQNFDMRGFRNRLPYPWSGLAGILRPEAYARLREELPPVAMFQKVSGKTRRHGLQSHDRYVLEYEPGLDLPPSWRSFIDELRGPFYREWLTQAIGSDRCDLYFHWHYTPTGKSVSPHCDAPRKLGSHVFYFNTEDDWDPAWGGATVILDDRGRFSRRSVRVGAHASFPFAAWCGARRRLACVVASRRADAAARHFAARPTVISLKRIFAHGWLHKSQRLRIVAVNGVRYKRLVLHDAYMAAEIERNLEAFGTSPRLPRLVTRFENEVWLEFVPGESLAQADDRVAAEVAEFYAELYSKAPRSMAAADTPLPQRLERDLRFLHDTGVIGAEAWRDLSAAAERLQPPTLSIGFEYTDPVLKNFVRPASLGPLCAIDVESLVRDRPLGAGIAKATVFWLTAPQRERLLARLDGSVPKLRAQMPFVELCFLARWVKTKFLTGKRKLAHEQHFEPFRGQG